MRFIGTCYRAHDPRWSFLPVSGEGAAVHGGRFNPKGIAALYLALTAEGAIIEASATFSERMEPLILCSYTVDCEDILDLTDKATLLEWMIEEQSLQGAWRLDLSNATKPLTWA